MKTILFVAAFIYFNDSTAQKSSKLLATIPVYKNPKIPDWIDTTNKCATKYGDIVRLKQDNMPCIMPYTSAVKTPNGFKKTYPIPRMPNLWERDSMKLKMIPIR